MQVLKQWCTQKHSSKAQIYSRKVGEGFAFNQWILEPFYRR